MSILILSHLDVRNANAQPAWWIIGPPPPTAYAGFAHALALALGAERCRGFAVVHHDIQFLGETVGRNLHPHQFRAASFIDENDHVKAPNPDNPTKLREQPSVRSSNNATVGRHPLSSQPTARCHLNVSLALAFDDDDALDIDHALPRFLRGARLAGGALNGYRESKQVEGAQAVVKFLKGGRALHERQDLMVREEGERDMLDVVLRLTDPQRRDATPPWLMPTALGYRAITPFRERRNARNGLPHAYAEPLVGLVQYRALRDGPLPFWRAVQPDAATFLLTTQP